MNEKQRISLSHYRPGDEKRIVDFLNLCFGHTGWGDMQKWYWNYTSYPAFEGKNVFTIRKEDEIVGHRGLHFRNLVVRGCTIPTASLGDTAVDPRYRCRGLYRWLHKLTLEAARSGGACLAFTWNRKGSTTYRNNRKTYFIELKQSPTYFRIINPEKLLKVKVSNFIRENKEVENMLLGLKTSLYLSLGGFEFPIAELLDRDSERLLTKRRMLVVFHEMALPLLVNLKNRGKFRKIKCLLLLFLGQKVRIKFSSPIALLKSILTGLRLLRYV